MRRKILACILHNPIVALIDVLLINIALILSIQLRWPGIGPSDDSVQAYIHEGPLFSIAAVIIFFMGDLYSDWLKKSKTEIAYSIISSSCMFAVVMAAIAFWFRHFPFPRSVVVISPAIIACLMLWSRLSLRRLRTAVTGRARGLVICSESLSGREISEQINCNEQDWLQVEAYLEAKDIINLYKLKSKFDTVIIVGHIQRKEEVIEFCATHKLQVLVVPEFLELSIIGARPLQIDDILLFNIHPPRLSPGQRILKRTLDVVGSAILLVLTAPLLVILTIIIRLSSKGPALFKQERVGRNGEVYTLYKLRTMLVDAEKSTGPVLATANDPRITGLGKFLRNTRLDELPQLFNVLSGEMSLVGPRPERPHFVSEFCLTVPSYQYRLSVKPGITGLAQVYGRYSTTAARKVRFDLMYIYDYSLVLDIKLLLKTFHVVLMKEKAAGVPARIASQASLLSHQSQAVGQESVITK